MNSTLSFESDAIRRIIREYTYEAGVRNLEREIGRVSRKVARMKAEGKKYPTAITAESIEKFLGPQQVFQTEAERSDEVGVVTSPGVDGERRRDHAGGSCGARRQGRHCK